MARTETTGSPSAFAASFRAGERASLPDWPRRRYAWILAAILCAPAALSAQVTGFESAKLLAPAPAPGDFFGARVALDGGRALVGAPTANDVGVNSGVAFVLDAASGQVLAKLTPQDPSLAFLFGESVALEGRLALVGSLLSSPGGVLSAGSAHLFDAGTGQELAVLLPQDPDPNDEFGSVALSGALAVVGANADDGLAPDAGAAYVFDLSSGSQLFKLVASDGAANDFFGLRVAVSGNRALIGAIGDDDGGPNAGSAYLFDVTTGQELFKLVASDGAAGHAFGQSVALSGNLALVGAPGTDGAFGAAYLFDATTGQELQKLVPPGGIVGFYGTSVALDESAGRALVGSPFDTLGSVLNTAAGSAHLFDTATGQEIERFLPSDSHANMAFGSAVALSGGQALAGAPDDGVSPGVKSGSAYVFDTACTALVTCSAQPNSTGQPATLQASGTTSVSANDLTLTVSGAPPQTTGQFFYGAQSAQIPLGDGVLCVGPPIQRLLPVILTDSGGSASLSPDLSQAPLGQGPLTAQPGQTLLFQLFFRDVAGGPAGFNLSGAVAVTFCP